MNNRWTNTCLGQSLIAICVISALFILCLNSEYGFILVPFYIFLLPAGFTNPYFFCIIFFILCVFRLHEIIPELATLHFPLVFAILSILSLSINIHLGRIKVYWRKEMIYFLLFSLWTTGSMLLAYNLEISFTYWSSIYIKIFVVFFMLTWTMTSEKAYKLIILLIVLSGVFLSLITLNNFVEGKALVDTTRATLGGVTAITDPNDLALTLLFSFSFCCSILVDSSGFFFIRLCGLLSTLIIITAIFVTQSRGGLLGLVGIIGYFATRKIKSKSTVVFLSIFITIILYLVIRGLFSRDAGAAAEGDIDESSMGRVYAWEAAINMAIHHPIFGVGLDGFGDNFYNYAVVWEKKTRAVHSSWFGVLAETGFPGLALFLCCVSCALRTAYKNIQYIEAHIQLFSQKTVYFILARGLYPGLIGFCISSTFLSQGFTWPFYAFFALTIALAHTLDTDIRSSA